MNEVDFQLMSSFDFIKFVAKLFRSRGFQTAIPDDDEYGVDLIVAAEGGLDRQPNGVYTSSGYNNRMVVRCVRSDGAVGPFPIAVISAAQRMYDARTGAVVTNGDFTPPAFHLARSTKVRMISRHRLQRMYEVSLENNLPEFSDMPDRHARCGLCYGGYVEWNDDHIEWMCSACANAVQGREGNPATVTSDTECAYCRRPIFVGQRAYDGGMEISGKEAFYCTSGKCRAERMMNPTAKQIAGKRFVYEFEE